MSTKGFQSLLTLICQPATSSLPQTRKIEDSGHRLVAGGVQAYPHYYRVVVMYQGLSWALDAVLHDYIQVPCPGGVTLVV
jgi:hypothetical protein